jgi:hypothetical protein
MGIMELRLKRTELVREHHTTIMSNPFMDLKKQKELDKLHQKTIQEMDEKEAKLLKAKMK